MVEAHGQPTGCMKDMSVGDTPNNHNIRFLGCFLQTSKKMFRKKNHLTY